MKKQKILFILALVAISIGIAFAGGGGGSNSSKSDSSKNSQPQPNTPVTPVATKNAPIWLVWYDSFAYPKSNCMRPVENKYTYSDSGNSRDDGSTYYCRLQ